MKKPTKYALIILLSVTAIFSFSIVFYYHYLTSSWDDKLKFYHFFDNMVKLWENNNYSFNPQYLAFGFLNSGSSSSGNSGIYDEDIPVGEWVEEPDTLCDVEGAVYHWYIPEKKYMYYRVFHSLGDRKFYYNKRHGFYVLLPDGMEYNQGGESIMGGHFNGFSNDDGSLSISASASYYDVFLLDDPGLPKTMMKKHIRSLRDRGKVSFFTRTPDEATVKVKINHSDPENKIEEDYFLSKFVLRKDVFGRECGMELIISYTDSMKFMENELIKILHKFPDNPFDSEE